MIVGTDWVVQGFVVSDSNVEKGIELCSSWKKEFDMVTARSSMTSPVIVSQLEVVLVLEEVEEVGRYNLLGRSLVKHMVLALAHPAVSHSPAKGVWQVRRARDGHNLESLVEEGPEEA
jgi:hypothetical protein